MKNTTVYIHGVKKFQMYLTNIIDRYKYITNDIKLENGNLTKVWTKKESGIENRKERRKKPLANGFGVG